MRKFESSRFLFVFSFTHYSFSPLKTASFAFLQQEHLLSPMNYSCLLLGYPLLCYLYHLFLFNVLVLVQQGQQALKDVFVNFFIEILILQVIFILIFICFFLKVLTVVGKFFMFQNLCFLRLPSLLMIIISDVRNLDCFFFSYLYLLLKLLSLILLIFL